MSMNSLIITEFKDRIPFSKSSTYRFDGLNRFIIESYRSDEINELNDSINREDLIIL